MSARSIRRPDVKERQREAAADAIVEAAEQVAAERGIESTSIAAIAERAGVAVGTLYNYFPDREALLASWFAKRRKEMIPRIEAAATTHGHLPFEQWLRAYLGDLFAVFEEKRQFIRVMAALDQRSPSKYAPSKSSAVLTAMIGAAEEQIAKIAPKRAEEYARMLVGMIRGISHWRSEHGGDMSQDAALIAETFLHGIAPR